MGRGSTQGFFSPKTVLKDGLRLLYYVPIGNNSTQRTEIGSGFFAGQPRHILKIWGSKSAGSKCGGFEVHAFRRFPATAPGSGLCFQQPERSGALPS
jgi:hypothetical protein